MNARIGNMIRHSLKHLRVKCTWMRRKHRKRRTYFKWFRRTQRTWDAYLKADRQLTMEDRIWFRKELVKLLKAENEY